MALDAGRGDDWIINGNAGFVANASIAGLIFALTDAGLLQVQRNTPGLIVGAPAPDSDTVIPWFHGSGANVTFRDCAVPAVNRLTVPDAVKLAMRKGITLHAAVNLGLGYAAFEAANTVAGNCRAGRARRLHPPCHLRQLDRQRRRAENNSLRCASRPCTRDAADNRGLPADAQCGPGPEQPQGFCRLRQGAARYALVWLIRCGGDT